MDWCFTKVVDYDGSEYNVACFAMVCHHCGQQYVEFFPNAKQENLFIGMIHAFGYKVNEKSLKNVWWKCKTCGNEWKSVIKARVNGTSCPARLP